MNTRLFTVAFGLFGLASLAAHAQPAAARPALTPPAFQSALESYQPYTDDNIVDWKAANDTTARIGGWRAYAKEASAPAVPATPAASPAPALPKP